MPTEEQLALNERTFTALGRFVVKFSGVLYAHETSTAQLIGLGGSNATLLNAALADRTASPIVSSFFSVLHARWADLLTAGDKKILKCLRRELDDLIKTRNRLMHDAWMSSSIGGAPGPHALSRFRIRAHGTGVEYEHVSYCPEDLDSLAAEAFHLGGIVNTCVWYHRPGQVGAELETRLKVVDNKVIRREGGA